jgi:hypothetical protein
MCIFLLNSMNETLNGRQTGGSGAAIFDYARGGPQWGADALLIGPPKSPVRDPNHRYVTQITGTWPKSPVRDPNHQYVTQITGTWPKSPVRDPNHRYVTQITGTWPKSPVRDPNHHYVTGVYAGHTLPKNKLATFVQALNQQVAHTCDTVIIVIIIVTTIMNLLMPAPRIVLHI